MFQFTNFSLLLLCIHNKILEVCSSGFPHSDIPGSKDICSSPRLFAACHVLLRLSVPRHSPYALGRLTRNIFLFNCQVSWWRWGDSNSWPPACKAGALPTELHPQKFYDSTNFWGFCVPLFLLYYPSYLLLLVSLTAFGLNFKNLKKNMNQKNSDKTKNFNWTVVLCTP